MGFSVSYGKWVLFDSMCKAVIFVWQIVEWKQFGMSKEKWWAGCFFFCDCILWFGFGFIVIVIIIIYLEVIMVLIICQFRLKIVNVLCVYRGEMKVKDVIVVCLYQLLILWGGKAGCHNGVCSS